MVVALWVKAGGATCVAPPKRLPEFNDHGGCRPQCHRPCQECESARNRRAGRSFCPGPVLLRPLRPYPADGWDQCRPGGQFSCLCSIQPAGSGFGLGCGRRPSDCMRAPRRRTPESLLRLPVAFSCLSLLSRLANQESTAHAKEFPFCFQLFARSHRERKCKVCTWKN